MATSFTKVLTKGVQSALARTPIENGKLRFATDTGRLFIDNNNTRVEITDFCKDYTEEGILNIVSPLPKVYIASDTFKMMVYDATKKKWIYASGKSADTATNASTAQYGINAGTAEYSSNAGTASYVKNAGTAQYSNNASSAKYSANASTAEYSKNSGTAEYSKNASTAQYGVNAGTAEYSKNSGTAEYSTNASTANYSLSSNQSLNASTAEYATNSDHAANASTAEYADSTNLAEYANSAGYASNAGTAEYSTNSENASTAVAASSDLNGNAFGNYYAPLESPLFTGIPSTPTPAEESNDTQVANTEYVTNAINKAMASITKIAFKIVENKDNLPTIGEVGTFYFVPIENASEEDNTYDEYIWLESSNKYEHLGTRKLSLDGYIKNFSLTGTGNAITGVTLSDDGSNLNFQRNNSFLTKHPSVTLHNQSTSIWDPVAENNQFSVIDNIIRDEFGHIKDFNIKTINMPNTVTNVSTAQYGVNAGTAQYSNNASSAKYSTNASTAEYSKNSGTAEYSKNAAKSSNGIGVGNTAPDVGLLWVDTANGNTLKFRTSADSTVWNNVASIWS